MKHKIKFIILIICCLGNNGHAQKINPPAGRIAIVADGNSPDPDDLGGTAMIWSETTEFQRKQK